MKDARERRSKQREKAGNEGGREEGSEEGRKEGGRQEGRKDGRMEGIIIKQKKPGKDKRRGQNAKCFCKRRAGM